MLGLLVFGGRGVFGRGMFWRGDRVLGGRVWKYLNVLIISVNMLLSIFWCLVVNMLGLMVWWIWLL